MLNNIPASMMHFKQWVCWRLEKKAGDNNKPSKVPYCPQTGRHAANNNPAHWTNFEHAKNAYETVEGYDGIGFVLTKDDPFCVIDLDPCSTQAQVDFQESVSSSFDTYQEISPSGNGLHIWCKASVPSGRKNSEHKVEIYSSGRYMTMTGNVFRKTDIKLQQALVSSLWDYIGRGRTEAIVNHTNGVAMTRTDLEIYNVAANAANGAKFLDLWNGNWQKYDLNGEGQSSGDLALVNIPA